MTAESLRKLLPYTSIAVLLAALYVAYTFYDRKNESDQANRAAAEKSAEQAQEEVARLGGTKTKITAFYASPGVIAKGQTALLCYGVVNVESLELEPPVEKVWPSLSRCFDIKPKETTTYRLTAHGKSGSATNSINVTVQ